MKIIFALIAISIVSVGIITIPLLSEQFVDAKSPRKVHFTQTITSSQDPGIGHESHQLALILSPNTGTIYDGSLTYAASKPVQIVVLHEIGSGQSKGQPTWTVDGDTHYALSLVEPGISAGSFEFTGAALALHTPDSSEFTATVSVDGWIRGQPTEVIMQTIQVEAEDPKLELSRANVPAKIPLHKGLYNGEELLYIITDTNGQKHADLISEKQKWKVELAPPLSNTPKDALANVYMFTNGIAGDGIYNYQDEVFSNTPEQTEEYSALRSVSHVEWKTGQNPEILDSEEKILEAKEDGRVEIEQTETIINMPQIKWPEGQMPIREDPTITNDMAYGEAQITELNEETMTVTFIAHRGWGPNGETIYYIVTDATPTGPAEMMGVVDAPTSANLIANAAAVDLFQFNNGIISSGPLGFQPGIAAAIPGDENYSPMWRIFIVEWDDPSQATLLETKSDIDALNSEELITVTLARPLNSDHIVNCPFIDPFQSFDEESIDEES